MRIRSLCLVVGVILCRLNVPAAAEEGNPTTNRINGVAEFLMDRASANAMVILQREMRGNSLLRCYLPETYKSATSKNLQLLLQSGPELWRQSVESDLENFGAHYLLNRLSTETIKVWVDQTDAYYIAILQNTMVRVGGKEVPVDRIPLDADPKLRDTVNSFYSDYFKERDKLTALVASMSDAKPMKIGECPAPILPEAEKLGEMVDGLKVQLARFQKSDVSFKASATVISAQKRNLSEGLLTLAAIDKKMKLYQREIEQIRNEPGLVVQMFRLDQLIRRSADAGDNPLISKSELKEYEQFSRYALSLATLSDSQSVSQAKSVMSQLAIAPVSFSVKRDPGVNKLMLSAYFGAAGGIEYSGKSRGYGGLTVPVGLEYTKGLPDQYGSLSLMFAPLDLANPVNQNINKRAATAEFKDIFSPGVYLSYGFKELPLICGVGYSHGPSLTVAGGNRGRGLLFIGLDMPLIKLF